MVFGHAFEEVPSADPTDLWANDDEAQYKTAQQVLSGRYGWFEEDVLDPAGDGPMMPTHPQPAAGQTGDSHVAAVPVEEASAAR